MLKNVIRCYSGMSGMSGNNRLDNKPYCSDGGVGAGLGGAAHYLSARNIHSVKGGYVNNSHNTNVEPRMNCTNVKTATTRDDDNKDDVDYDELPFKIYKIEYDNALTISKECILLEYHEMTETYGIDEEGVLENFFDDDRYFFVENKVCLIICHKQQVFYWKPHNFKDVDHIDWDKQFLSMKKDICNYFDIANNENLMMMKGEDIADVIEASDMEKMWNNMREQDNDTIYIKILVKGDPLTDFLIDYQPTDNNSQSTFRRKINLNNKRCSNTPFTIYQLI